MRILVNTKPKMYGEAIALALHKYQPEAEVMLISAETLDGEIGSFRPHLILHNDDVRIAPEELERVVCRIEILFSDGMDARIIMNGQVVSKEDMSLEEMFSVVDEVEKLVLGETPG